MVLEDLQKLADEIESFQWNVNSKLEEFNEEVERIKRVLQKDYKLKG